MGERRIRISRRRFLAGAAAGGAAWLGGRPRASAQAKPPITYWNGLTGADGKVMDELIDRFTRETGIRIEQQRMPWADLYAKLQVSVPAGEGPDLALIHTVEVPHFASDGMLEPIDEGTLGAKGFRARGLHAVDVAGRHLPGQALLDPARRAAAPPLPQREADEGGRPRGRRRAAARARQPRRARGHGQADRQG